MRTRIGPVSGHSSLPSARCASTAARSALGACWNAAQNASPMVLKTTPPLLAIASRMIASCFASAVCIAMGCASHSLVLPSTSVNRNVTNSVGISDGSFCSMCGCRSEVFSDTQLPVNHTHDTTAAGRLHRDQDYSVDHSQNRIDG